MAAYAAKPRRTQDRQAHRRLNLAQGPERRCRCRGALRH